jgi:GT2 family glycosyltransferase
MIKRKVFEELHGFDERFFVYYEELDLSKRVKDAGYKTIFVSESQAYHKAGGTSDQVKAKRLFYNTRSRIIYGFKHFGVFKGSILLVFTFIVEPFSRMFFLIMKGKYREIAENFKGFGLMYKDVINIIKLGLKK